MLDFQPISNSKFENENSICLSFTKMFLRDIRNNSLSDNDRLYDAVHFNDLYGDRDETFVEEEGRKYFLLYLRPIINGTGNYYIESRTREMRRTDIIIDYRGQQYIIEMKIWHGNEYNSRGEQ